MDSTGNVQAPPLVPAPTVVGLVFRATLRELARRRRVLLMGLIALLPIALTLLWSSIGREHIPATAFFNNLVALLYLQVLVYLVGLAFGVPTLHDEIEGRTLTYLITRPLSRTAVYAGKLLAVQVLAAGMLALSLVGCFAIMVVGEPGLLTLDFLKLYANHVWVVLLGTACLTAIFAAFGTIAKRPLMLSLLYAFAWETAVSRVPGNLQTWTVSFHVRNLAINEADIERSLFDLVRQLLGKEVSVSGPESLAVLAGVLVVATLAGGWIFGRKEYNIQ